MIRARFAIKFPLSEIRGRREDRGRAAPAVSRAKCANKDAREHTGSAEAIRPSLRNGFKGFLRALPGDRALSPPSSLRSVLPKNLTPASGRQDHTTSPSASALLVVRHIRVHRIPFRVDDVGQRPSVVQDAAISASDLPDGTSGIFFGAGLDRAEWESELICPSCRSLDLKRRAQAAGRLPRRSGEPGKTVNAVLIGISYADAAGPVTG
jgi:hypothetical protein